MKYAMERSYRVGYLATGIVFLAAAVYLWAAGGRAKTDLFVALAVAILGALLVLRPFRACMKVEDDGCLYYCDGYLPGRRFPIADIQQVWVRKGRKLTLRLKNGTIVNLDYPYVGWESFLAELRTRGVEIGDK